MRNRLTISVQEDLKQFFLPLFIIFFLIAGIITLQTIYGSSAGPRTFFNYSTLFLSKFIFVEFFLLFFVLVYWLNKKLHITELSTSSAVLFHTAFFIFLLVSHQFICLYFNKILLINYVDVPLLDLFLKNPLIWYDVAIYPLAMSIFYLIKFKHLRAEKELRALEYESKLVNSQLDELKMKIHPHFLFQTLNNIKSLVADENYPKANLVLLQFSDVLRSTVYDSRTFESGLSDDLSLIQKYIKLQGANNVFLTTQFDDLPDSIIIPGQIVRVMVVELLEYIFGNSEIGFKINLRISCRDNYLTMAFEFFPEEEDGFDSIFDGIQNIANEVGSRLNISEFHGVIKTACVKQGGNVVVNTEIPVIKTDRL
jgi:hypothetical protein